MNKRRVFSLIVTGIFTALNISPSFAQAVDSQVLDTIKTAFSNTLLVSSLTVNVQSSTEREDQNLPAQQSTQSYQLALDASGWNITGTYTTTLNAGIGDDLAAEQITLELIIVDGITYVRFTNIPEAIAQQGLPHDWVDISQLVQVPMGQILSVIPTNDSLPSDINNVLSLPLDEGVLTAVTELEAETIEGQNMRVFQMALDPTALTLNEATALLSGQIGGIGFGGGFGPGGQLRDPESAPSGQPPIGDSNRQPPAIGQDGQLPERQNGQPPAGFQPPNMEYNTQNTQATVTVWIGDDLLVHRLSSVVKFMPTTETTDAPMVASTTTTVTADLSEFNQSVTITAP